MTALTKQIGGDHYKSLKIQPVEYIHANGIPFIEGCIIKYATRWREKGEINDLRKIIHFAELLIELEAMPGAIPEPAPWYPDDSGEWVEVVPGSRMPDALDKYTDIEILTRWERNGERYASIVGSAKRWDWGADGKPTDSDIVAYKLAK